jgi:hypothetical protein
VRYRRAHAAQASFARRGATSGQWGKPPERSPPKNRRDTATGDSIACDQRGANLSPAMRIIHFHCALHVPFNFSIELSTTRKLARTLDSLVRVSRRVGWRTDLLRRRPQARYDLTSRQSPRNPGPHKNLTEPPVTRTRRENHINGKAETIEIRTYRRVGFDPRARAR